LARISAGGAGRQLRVAWRGFGIREGIVRNAAVALPCAAHQNICTADPKSPLPVPHDAESARRARVPLQQRYREYVCKKRRR